VLKKIVLAVVAIFAVICLAGCIQDLEKGPKPGTREMVRCVAVKDINVLEVEDYGEIHLYGVKEPWWSKEYYEQGLKWLREVCEGKDVLVWFGDEIINDGEGRPYAMVFLDQDEESCVNTELIERYYADIDPSHTREDFVMHPAWDKMIKNKNITEDVEHLKEELKLHLNETY